MQLTSQRRPSPARTGAKWLILSVAFVWLVGCANLGSTAKKGRDPFTDPRFKCGEEKPPGKTTASLGHS